MAKNKKKTSTVRQIVCASCSNEYDWPASYKGKPECWFCDECERDIQIAAQEAFQKMVREALALCNAPGGTA